MKIAANIALTSIVLVLYIYTDIVLESLDL